ncbi:amino acid permease [Bacillus sp. RG28]|uniref:Amino acid permease n=1 Tax=Gottfriedia endophytica TaxID=2820819 RepID=A0A940NNT8_9BACI|nr:amino acid permease [Gottfriedia endophytica]MBP0726036.1 amino acid permease [Gottfriedia endophytica]
MDNLFKKKEISDLLTHTSGTKSLGSFDLTLMGIGTIIGTGIMVLTGIVAAKNAGPSIIFSFILAGIICGIVALCYAELGSALPISGSIYTYTYVSIGEFVAFLTGWCVLSIYLLSVAAVANSWTSYFGNFLDLFNLSIPKNLTNIPGKGGIMNLPAICVVLLITWLVSRGTKESKKVNNLMVLVKLCVIFLFIVVGSFYVKPSNWTPFFPFGIHGVITGAASVFFSFIGFDAIATSAEEVKNPQRDLAFGIIASLLISTVLYIGVCLVMTGVVPFKELNVPDAMAYVLKISGANLVSEIISLGAIIGMLAVILACIYASTRILFVMSRDQLLPRKFSSVHAQSNVPTFSTYAVGTIGAILAGFIDLKLLTNLVNISALLTFIMVTISLMILRKTKPELKRSFKVPFVPILPLITLICCIGLMINLPLTTWILFLVWLVLGMGVYLIYRKWGHS